MTSPSTTLLALVLVAMGTFPPKGFQPAKVRSTPPTRNEKLWDTMEIKPSKVFKIDKLIARFVESKPRYVKIEKMRNGGVPAAVIFGLHYRESSLSWKRHLHEGSPLTGRTRYVPKGRPKAGSPPFTWEESAEDALYKLKDLESVRWDRVSDALHAIEKYNGLGYLYKGRISPYVHSGNKHYTGGKYYADHKYSSKIWDKQLGVATILKRMQDRNIEIGFR